MESRNIADVLLREFIGLVPGLFMLAFTMWLAGGGDPSRLLHRVKRSLRLDMFHVGCVQQLDQATAHAFEQGWRAGYESVTNHAP